MSPQLKEFITVVLLDLAKNCDWTISPTGQIEHSPFFEYAEKHAHIIETELDDMREMFREYVKADNLWDILLTEGADAYEEALAKYHKLRKQAKEVLGL